MADLLIKGFDMPKGCYYDEPPYHCPFYDCLKCTILNTYAPARPYKYLPDCPLVEVPTHGRLKDADELKELFRETITGIATRTDMKGAYEHMIRASAMVIEMIDDAPTVIEASEVE